MSLSSRKLVGVPCRAWSTTAADQSLDLIDGCVPQPRPPFFFSLISCSCVPFLLLRFLRCWLRLVCTLSWLICRSTFFFVLCFSFPKFCPRLVCLVLIFAFYFLLCSWASFVSSVSRSVGRSVLACPARTIPSHGPSHHPSPITHRLSPIAYRRPQHGQSTADIIEDMRSLGMVYCRQGNYDRAEGMYRK